MKNILKWIFVLMVQHVTAQPTLDWVKDNFQAGNATVTLHQSTLDKHENYFVTGLLKGTADFDADTGKYILTAINTTAFLACYDSSGKLIFAKLFGNAFVYNFSIDVITDSSILVCGSFKDTADFDPDAGVHQLINTTSISFFMLKLNAAGNFLWVKKIDGFPVNYAYGDGKFDTDGNVYFAGAFSNTIDFDPDSSVLILASTSGYYNGTNIFLLKLNENGNLIFAKNFPCNGRGYFGGLKIDVNNNIIISGNYSYIMDFDPDTSVYQLNSSGKSNTFILKLDATSKFKWAVDFTYTYGQSTAYFTLDKFGNTYCTGAFNDSIDMDPGPGTYNLYAGTSLDFFIAKLDTSAGLIWARNVDIPVNSYGWPHKIVVDDSLNVYALTWLRAQLNLIPQVDTFYLTPSSTSVEMILEFNQNGDAKWGNSIYNYSNGFAVSTSGNIYQNFLMGTFYDLDPDTGVFVPEWSSSLVFRKLNSHHKLDWAFHLGGSNRVWINSVLLSKDDVVTVGRFTGKPDFDSDTSSYFLSSAYGTTHYIHKQNKAGKTLWVKRFRETDTSPLSYINYQIDANENIIAYGNFYGTADVNPGPDSNFISSGSNSAVYLFKLDKDGNFLWVDTIVDGNIGMYSLTTDHKGNIYCTGFFNGKVDFDPGVNKHEVMPNGTNRNCYILKLDSNGNFINVITFGTNITGEQIKIDENDNCILAGTFSSSQDFDPGPGYAILSTFQNGSQFIAKFDTALHFMWARKTGGNGYSNSKSIFINSDVAGNIFCGGTFAALDDFDPGPAFLPFTPIGTSDLYFQRYDAAGNLTWAKQLVGDTMYESISDIAVDYGSNLYVTGAFSGNIDFDWGLNSEIHYSHNRSGYVFCISDSGNFKWVHDFGDNDNYTVPVNNTYESGYSICVDNNASIFSAGLYYMTADFDPGTGTHNVTTSESGTTYLFRWNQCLNSNQTFHIKTCDSAFIVNQFAYSDTSISFLNLNQFGCDSNVTYVVKIHKSETDTLFITSCNSYLYNGITYTTSGIYTHTFSNSNQCDSTIILDLIINNDNDSAFSFTSCDNATFGAVTYYNTGIYQQQLTSSTGCDSLLTIDLTILESTDTSIYLSSCDSVIFDNVVYNTSGVYTINYMASNGCDSTQLLHITVNQSHKYPLSVNACNSYTFNNVTYSASGVYVINFLNNAGCDSTILLNLNIQNIDTSVILSGLSLQAATGLAYQWIDCNFNFLPLPGQNSQTYTPPVSGNYAVIVNNGSCSDTSACNLIMGVGIIELIYDNFNLWPNPTTGEFQIQFTNGVKNIALKIFDITGRELFVKEYSSTNFIKEQIDFASGIYMANVTADGRVYNVRLIKL